MITDYHAKLHAHELIRRCPGSIERFTPALMDSQVDLNPHQVDAALFAFRLPLYKGVIFADEVGLGKTIEAGVTPAFALKSARHLRRSFYLSDNMHLIIFHIRAIIHIRSKTSS
ncbi:MAG: hypothetical protein WA081_17355 [Desulfosalsimonadaceae bacterium]